MAEMIVVSFLVFVFVGVEVVNLHGGNPIHINLNVRKKLDKVLMCGKFAEQTVVDPTHSGYACCLPT